MSAPRLNATAQPVTGRSELSHTLWAFRRELLVVAAFSVAVNLLMLTPTLYMLQIYDRVMASRSELTLLAVSLIALFFLALMSFAEFARSRVLVRAGVRFDQQLGTRVFNASFASARSRSGASPSRALGDLSELRQFLVGNGIFAFFDAPWAPVYIAVLFFLHPALGAMAIGFTLIQAALAWFGHRRTVAPLAQAARDQSDVTAYLQSKLRHGEVIESMGMLGALRSRWVDRHRASLATSHAVQGRVARVVAWSKFVRYTQQSLALGGGALLVIDGQLSPGAMIAANVLMTRALAPIDLLVSSWRGFIGARDAFGRLGALLEAHPQRHRAPIGAAPAGAISVRDVAARAGVGTAPILERVNFEVAAGTVTVIQGLSGSGKSTLARVLLGIWPDVSGDVRLDGRPLADWNRAELGPHLGYLPQDIELFDGSIAENIARFGDIDASKVIEAARSAGLHEMILRFSGGYDTPIGEAGSLLSGGQRQRIGLARALYGRPVLVVLDEPNANLDDAGEKALLAAVRELKARGATVFVISHRPGIVDVADRLLLLRAGSLQIEGPRDGVPAALKTPLHPVLEST